MQKTASRGFTVIEAIVVVMLMAVVSVLAVPLAGDIALREDLDTTVAGMADSLREAQVATMSGRGGLKYGVHFQGDRYVWYSGATFLPTNEDNVEQALPGGLTVMGVSLSPGGTCALPDGTGNCDVLFDDRRGAPAASGTITVTDGTFTRTLTINAVGMIDHD